MKNKNQAITSKTQSSPICLALTIAAFLIFSTGCSLQNMQAQAPPYPDAKTESYSVVTENEPKNYANTPIYPIYPTSPTSPTSPTGKSPTENNNVAEQESRNDTTKERIRNLADAITLMDGVDTANVVITGNTAIVGITLETEMEDGRLIDLKREIEKRAKQLDNEIDHVAVTAAPELVERIIQMQKDPAPSNEGGVDFIITPTI